MPLTDHTTRARRAAFAGVSFYMLLFSFFIASASEDEVQFNRDIRPIMSDTCFLCHGPAKAKAGLRMDRPESAFSVTDSGETPIVPGHPEKSEAVKRIFGGEGLMPPKSSNKTLTAAQKELIKRWVAQGANYQKHWSYEAPVKVEPPEIAGAPNPIDAFLQARMKADGLKPAPEAPREILIRRVTFALTGLPPTPKEVGAFLTDTSPTAYENVVDRLMASPRFGEEMARIWLDVARYGDTHGLHLDNERQMWAYRDWVINAFNTNQPFDKFTVDQIAGDLIPNHTREQVVATGYNRCNITTGEGGSINEELLYRYAVDRTATTAQTWLGMTAGCAVCHDHKFDPLSQKEFYSLYAFFNSAADPAMDGNVLLTAPTVRLSTAEHEKKLAEFDAQIAAKQKALDEKTAVIAYQDPEKSATKPPVQTIEDIWLDDDFPKGAAVKASPGQPTAWLTAAQGAPIFSGTRALKRSDKGLAQDYYDSGAAPIELPQDAEIFCHVYVDPKDIPKTIMLQFHTGGDWKHRAVWGDYEAIDWGAKNTTQRVKIGAMPEAGKWVKLSFPASKLGLNADTKISGIALTLTGGTVYWDKMGVSGKSDPASDARRSLSAWLKERAGKDTPEAPKDIAALLKAGPDKKHKPEDEKKVLVYYLQNVCVDSKKELQAPALELSKLKAERDAFDKDTPGTFVYNDLAKPRDSFVMMRGQYDKPGEKVEPSTPAILPPLKKSDAKARATRLDLANWIVAPENPLTARVAVNRFWQQFFGTGLVKTSGDFGSQGQPPSHPELLDYLAVSFREHGWNVKALVRGIVTSDAFRQSSAFGAPEAFGTPASSRLAAGKMPANAPLKPGRLEAGGPMSDPENRLLARGPRLRLDAEQIRDNALFVSGLIDLAMGGKGARTYQPDNIWEPVGFVGSNTRFYKRDTGSALYRRSIYCFLKRTAPPPFMSNFDAPSREQPCTRRERSDTPLQALQLMNDVQHVEAARAFAERLLTEGGATPESRIDFAYHTLLARAPEADEVTIVKAELQAHVERYTKDVEAAKKLIAQGESKPKASTKPEELAAYTLVANMLLNLDETVTRN